MREFKHKIAFIVATKDRPAELQRLLKSLGEQSYKPDQVIIVDGGTQPVHSLVKRFPNLPIIYLQCLPPSAARQRNTGIKAVNPEITLIGFLDDDAVLEADALESMMDFWEDASENIGGTSFNMVNHPSLYLSSLKSLPLTEKLGLYSKNKGVIMPSGFQTMIGFVRENTFVQWLPTTATIWRKRIFEEFQFDEWFEGYSYLEDLDFSYRVGKKYKLVVIADAKYYHYPDYKSSGRINAYEFGKKEISNRLYFVRKHNEFSLFHCYLALILRIFLNLICGIQRKEISYLQRILGNITGLISENFSQGEK